MSLSGADRLSRDWRSFQHSVLRWSLLGPAVADIPGHHMVPQRAVIPLASETHCGSLECSPLQVQDLTKPPDATFKNMGVRHDRNLISRRELPEKNNNCVLLQGGEFERHAGRSPSQ